MRKVHRHSVGSATGFAYLRDNSVGFLGAAAVVDENLGTGCGERKRTGAAHAARCAGNESSFASQSRHDHRPCCCCGGQAKRMPLASTNCVGALWWE